MVIFNENIKVSNTTHPINFLTVPSYQEVYFDLFEVEINGSKYLAEKIDEYKGQPVVSIPLNLEGISTTAPFVLSQGTLKVLFNKNNLSYVNDVEDADGQIYIEDSEIDEIEGLILEKRDSIIEDINKAKVSASEYLNKLKKQKVEEANLYHEKKIQEFNKELTGIKQELLEEFLQVTNNVRSEIVSTNNEDRDKLVKFISNKVNDLTSTISERVEDKAEDLERYLQERVQEMATDLVTGVIASELKSNKAHVKGFVKDSFETISTKLDDIIKEQNVSIERTIKNSFNEIDGRVLSVERASVELQDSLKGKVARDQFNETVYTLDNRVENIEKETLELRDTIDTASNNIKEYYNERIDRISKSIDIIDKQGNDNKELCLKLINESKNGLIKTLSDLKFDVPNIIIEKKDGTGKEINVKSIKAELEKSISTRFNLELSSLRRMMELMSGGGSGGGGGGTASSEFANGGTMNGNLTVTGYVSAGQYLNLQNSLSGAAALVGGNTLDTNLLIGTNDNYNLNLETGGTTRMTVTSSGYVGIGITPIGTQGEYLYISNTFSGNNTSYLRIDNTNNNGSIGVRLGSYASKADFYYDNITSQTYLRGLGSALNLGTFSGNSNAFVTFTTFQQERMRITGAGNVGIGTIAPAAKLHVVGANYSTAIIDAILYPSLHLYSSGVSIGNIGSGNITGANAIDLGIQTPTGSKLFLAAGSTAAALTVNNGKVGIGTANPTTGLHVYSTNTSVATFDGPTIPIVGFSINNSQFATFGSAGGNITGGTATDLAFQASNNLVFATGGTALSNIRMFVSSTGNVGIGTTTPSFPLHIVGNVSVLRARIQNTGKALYQAQAGVSQVASFSVSNSVVWDAGVDTDQKFKIAGPNGDVALLSTNTRLTIDASGNIGIGTITPGSNLTISGINVSDSAQPGADVLRGNLTVQSSDNWAIDKGGSIAFSGTITGTSQQQVFGGIAARKENITDGNARGYLALYASGTGSYEKMRIDSNGRVGIGITAPTERLQVNGAIRVSGDFANWSTNTGALYYFGGKTGLLSSGPDTGTVGGFLFKSSTSDGTGNSFTALSVEPTGCVGIGIVNPTNYTFSVNSLPFIGTTTGNWGKIGRIYMTGPGTGSYPDIGYNMRSIGGSYVFDQADSSAWITIDGNFRFKTGGSGAANAAITATERLTILASNGNVGIGATNPAKTLQLGDGTTVSPNLFFYANESSGNPEIRFATRNNYDTFSVSIFTTGDPGFLSIGGRSASTALISSLNIYRGESRVDIPNNLSGSILNILGSSVTNSATIFLGAPANDTTKNSRIVFGGNARTEGKCGIFFTPDGTGFNRGNLDIVVDTNTNSLTVSTPTTSGVTGIRLTSIGNVGIGTTTPAEKLDVVGNVKVSGHLTAATKSFLIDNPVKGGKLQYGVVESNEHSVFVRGKTDKDTIELPDDWDWLVHEDSVTVQLTPIGSYQQLFVISQDNKSVVVGGVTGSYNYTIYGERKDVDKLITEI